MHKIGRPSIGHDARTAQLRIRVTEREHRGFARAAGRMRVTLTCLLRRLLGLDDAPGAEEDK